MVKQFVVIFLGLVLLSSVPSKASAEEKWQEYRCLHFVIYYKNAPADFIKTIEEAAEEYYGEITRNMGFTRYKGWTWDNRALIYVYDDMDDYVESGRNAKWSHGMASPQDKTIRTFPSAHGFFDSTLPHELGHIIFHEAAGFKVLIPAWFEEGIAMRQEKAKRWGAHQAVRKAMKGGTFLSLMELGGMQLTTRTKEETVILFYTEAASVVNYLLDEFGNIRFTALCRKLKNGINFEQALKETYVRFRSIEDLNKAWVNFLKDE